MDIFPEELLSRCCCICCEDSTDITWFRIIGTKYWIMKHDGGFSFSKDGELGNPKHEFIKFEEFFEGVDGEFKDCLIFNLDKMRSEWEY